MNFTINGISNDLKKLDRYFRGTTIFTSLNTLLALTTVNSPKRLDFYLKDDESSVATLAGFPALFIFCSSFLNCHKLPEVSL